MTDSSNSFESLGNAPFSNLEHCTRSKVLSEYEEIDPDSELADLAYMTEINYRLARTAGQNDENSLNGSQSRVDDARSLKSIFYEMYFMIFNQINYSPGPAYQENGDESLEIVLANYKKQTKNGHGMNTNDDRIEYARDSVESCIRETYNDPALAEDYIFFVNRLAKLYSEQSAIS